MPPHWGHFKLGELHGDEIPNPDATGSTTYQPLTKKQYTSWMVNVNEAMAALRISWLLAMVIQLIFEEGVFVLIVDPDMDDDFNSLIFQYLVIQAAMGAGATRYLPLRDDPLGVCNIAENYDYVIDTITMFSAQMTSRCMTGFPNIYGRLQTVSHPLSGLHKWVTMHRIYNQETVIVDADQADILISQRPIIS